MNIKIDVDMTPEGMRRLMGLPDVQEFSREVMAQMLKKIQEGVFVKGNPIQAPFPAGLEQVAFGLGCFWEAEKLFWQLPGVYSTAVGYAGGYNEVVLVVFDPTSAAQRLEAEAVEAPTFYYAEDYHQQYLAKNPSGYCGLGGTGVKLTDSSI